MYDSIYIKFKSRQSHTTVGRDVNLGGKKQSSVVPSGGLAPWRRGGGDVWDTPVARACFLADFQPFLQVAVTNVLAA